MINIPDCSLHTPVLHCIKSFTIQVHEIFLLVMLNLSYPFFICENNRKSNKIMHCVDLFFWVVVLKKLAFFTYFNFHLSITDWQINLKKKIVKIIRLPRTSVSDPDPGVKLEEIRLTQGLHYVYPGIDPGITVRISRDWPRDYSTHIPGLNQGLHYVYLGIDPGITLRISWDWPRDYITYIRGLTQGLQYVYPGIDPDSIHLPHNL